MLVSLAKEYLKTINHIRYRQFRDHEELRWLEGQRGLLHRQMTELLGHKPEMSEVRALVLEAQAAGYY
jgi:hypothetical protein